jgi:glycosyltransferase involved in cell wall biosynthesis
VAEKKGCEYLLRAMEIVQRQDSKAHAKIIGDGPLRSTLEALAARFALRVRFRGVQGCFDIAKQARKLEAIYDDCLDLKQPGTVCRRMPQPGPRKPVARPRRVESSDAVAL